MSGFSNPIIGGGGSLVYPSIHSPNFVQSPLAGWAIDKNGNAFFQSVTIGGGVVKVTFSSSSPPSPGTGDVWFNTSNGTVSSWSGSAWTNFQYGTGAIANSAITNAQIAALAVNASNIANSTITTTQIAAAAGILGAQIAATTISDSNMVAHTITAGSIAANTITAAQIAANTITAGQIAANTITAGQIAAGTITATQILANTITASQIAAGTITATQIAASTITAGKIAANTITAAQIAANTITAAQLAAGIVYAGIVDATTITGSTINGSIFNGSDFILNTSGQFFYSSAPASGNLIASIAPSSGTDGFGNVYFAGTWGYGTTFHTGINSSGLLEIVAGTLETAALSINGNFLQIQMVDSNGTNTLQFPGPLSSLPMGYNGVGGLSISAGPTALQALSATSAAITNAVTAASAALSKSSASGNILSVTNAASTPTAPTVQLIGNAAADRMIGVEVAGDSSFRYRVDTNGHMDWGPGSTGTDTNLYRNSANVLKTDDEFDASVVQVSSAQAGGNVFRVTNTTSTPTNASSLIIANAAADRAFGIAVNGDASNRLAVDSNGRISWGPGNATQDTDLYRASAGVLETDTAMVIGTSLTSTGGSVLAPTLITTDTWHSLGTLAGYVVGTAGYRLLPDGDLEIDIAVTGGGANAASVNFSATMPAAYRPINNKNMGLTGGRVVTAGDPMARVIINTTGVVAVDTVASNSSFWAGTCRFPLNL